MKRKAMLIVVILVMLLMAVPALATTYTFSTPTGSTNNGGEPVSATATLTLSTDSIVIDLENTLANPNDISQCLSDFAFTLNNFTPPPNSTNSESTTEGGGTPINIAADGSYTTETPITNTVNLGWLLSQSGSGFLLNDLGGAGPAHCIIGPPDSNNIYSNANSSIAGNGPHNPVLLTNADFYLTIPGVTDNTGVSSVTFSFGTTAGNNVDVPLPPSVLLLGSGLLGLVGLGWRRRKG
jgi:hypothetical protein